MTLQQNGPGQHPPGVREWDITALKTKTKVRHRLLVEGYVEHYNYGP
jgi:hypothetical protein